MEKYSFKSVTFGGFDKQDVMRYIEQASEKSAVAQKELEEERDALLRQLEEQVRQTEALQAQVKALAEERDGLQVELEFERSAKRKLEPLQALEAEVARLAMENDALRPDAKAYAQFRERLGSIECEARKRADDIEGEARARADAMEMTASVQVRKTLDSFRGQYQTLMEAFGNASVYVLEELRKLEVSLTQLPLAMDQTSAELERLSASVDGASEAGRK